MLNKKVRLIITAALSAALLLSGCGEASETVDETAAKTAEKTFTDEELDEMAKNMPEIVFVMSHHYDDTNILGCYVTNTGEMKLYDFRNIAPNEIYEIPDVYDRLEEAACSEIYFPDSGWREEEGKIETTEGTIREDDLTTISADELANSYKKLLLADKKYTCIGIRPNTIQGNYEILGVRSKNNDKEFFLLRAYGDNDDLISSDPYAAELYEWLCEKFPKIPDYFEY